MRQHNSVKCPKGCRRGTFFIVSSAKQARERGPEGVTIRVVYTKYIYKCKKCDTRWFFWMRELADA